MQKCRNPPEIFFQSKARCSVYINNKRMEPQLSIFSLNVESEPSRYYLCHLILKDLQENRTPHLACILLFIIHNVGLFPQFQFFLVHSAQNLVVKLLLRQTCLSFCYNKATLFSNYGNLNCVQRGSFVHTVFEALHLYLCICIWGSLYLYQQHIVSPP